MYPAHVKPKASPERERLLRSLRELGARLSEKEKR
jgi:hypothetical protein